MIRAVLFVGDGFPDPIFQILNRSPNGEEPTPNPSQEGNKKEKGKKM
jgi:hypothetical protein